MKPFFYKAVLTVIFIVISLLALRYVIGIFDSDESDAQIKIIVAIITLSATLSGLSFRVSSLSKVEEIKRRFFVGGLKLMYCVLCFAIVLGLNYCFVSLLDVAIKYHWITLEVKESILILPVLTSFVFMVIGFTGFVSGLHNLTQLFFEERHFKEYYE